ncbi:MAG: CRISPR-associated ring nuclease [Syntrophobacteraceae bacterium]|jgi:CRISPR-associated protein (TIGR02584 family)
MTTLIASMGQSPAVITETLDHLRDNKHLIFDRLVILVPGKLRLARAIKAAGFLEHRKDFSLLTSSSANPDYPREILWRTGDGLLDDLEDISSETEATAFYRAVVQATSDYCYWEDVYYAIAGGRKSMAALMVLAAQILPVKGIFHILLNDSILIANKTALSLRDDDTLLEFLTEVEGSDAPDIQAAFHPGSQATTLVEIPFRCSFDRNIIDSVMAELQKAANPITFDDVRRAIFNYCGVKPQFQAPPCVSQNYKDSPKRLDHPKCILTDDEKRLAKQLSDALMRAIPQICETEHHFGGDRKSKDASTGPHCYDRHIHGMTSRFETMFPISSVPPSRVRLHIITTATNQYQMDFLWQRILEHCGVASVPAPAVLISTLGESPGVVTSAVHFYEHVRTPAVVMKQVVVVAPQNEGIRRNCRDLLERQACLQHRMSYEEFAAHDIRGQKDLDRFMEKMKEIVDRYVMDGYRIYLNLAGGRKVMSAALLLLAQLHPVEEAFHLSILDKNLDRDIERHGTWDHLKELQISDPGTYRNILYPDRITALVLPVSQYAKTSAGFDDARRVL